MADVKAFKALRFTEKAGDISKNVCPPYDIISDGERAEYIAQSENNIIRLEKPIGENAYDDAKTLYLDMCEKGLLSQDEKSGYYVYEEEFEALGKTYKIKGIFARVRIEEFEKGIILPHEETLSKAKQDRFNLMCSTGCSFSPIYCMYTDEKREIASLVDVMSEKKPETEFAAKDGVIQRLWKCDDEELNEKVELLFKNKQLFIADGHHRYETALRYRNELISGGEKLDENHPARFIMMFLIDMENDGLVVFPTHRMVTGLDGFDTTKALCGIREFFDTEEISENEIDEALTRHAAEKANVFVAPNRKFYLCSMKDSAFKKLDEMNPGKSEAYKKLDVTVLHSLVLENVLGIDKENMANQINLKYTRSKVEAVESVKNGKADCAFIINPTGVDEIKNVALAGEKMPQKSTYFYPKLITGLVMNRIKLPEALD